MIIACPDLDVFFDGELGGAHAAEFRVHLGGCARCQRVLHGRVQEAMALDLHHDRRVPSAIALRRRRRLGWLAAALPVLGAAAVGAVTLARSHDAPRTTPLEVALSVDHTGPAMRGKTAHPGDVLRVSASGARHRAIWVYRNEATLVAACPGAPPCRAGAAELALELVLTARGSYAVVTLGAASALPAPAGTLDADLDAASTIDGSYQIGHVEVD